MIPAPSFRTTLIDDMNQRRQLGTSSLIIVFCRTCDEFPKNHLFIVPPQAGLHTNQKRYQPRQIHTQINTKTVLYAFCFNDFNNTQLSMT